MIEEGGQRGGREDERRERKEHEQVKQADWEKLDMLFW